MIRDANSNRVRPEGKIILLAGQTLEKYNIVPRNKICAKLKKDFNGFIHISTVWEICSNYNRDWINKTNTHKGVNQYTGRAGQSKSSVKIRSSEQPLTEQEKEYVQAQEQEVIRNKNIAGVVYDFTHIDNAGIGKAIEDISDGLVWRKTLADMAHDNIPQEAKRISRFNTVLILYSMLVLYCIGLCTQNRVAGPLYLSIDSYPLDSY